MENSYKYFKTQIANIFRVTRDFRMTLIVCFVIVLCIVCQTVQEVRPTQRRMAKNQGMHRLYVSTQTGNYDKIIQILIRNNNN